MTTPTLEELLQAGVHFGHKVSRWHPKMAPYVYGNKNGVHIINLEKTAEILERTLELIKKLAASGKVILFVGTKEQGQEIIRKAAKDCGAPYVVSHWVGGTLTNFDVILNRVKYLKKLEDDKKRGKLKRYTKNEQLIFDKEMESLGKIFEGLRELKKLPDVVFIVDVKRERSALREAARKEIPIIALADTNINPEDVDYPIPANDDGIKSLELIIGLVAAAIKEGREEAAKEVGKQEA